MVSRKVKVNYTTLGLGQEVSFVGGFWGSKKQGFEHKPYFMSHAHDTPRHAATHNTPPKSNPPTVP